jgi:hypothetical protein
MKKNHSHFGGRGTIDQQHCRTVLLLHQQRNRITLPPCHLFLFGCVLLFPESLQKFESSASLSAGTPGRRKTSICLSSGQAIPAVRCAPVLVLFLHAAALFSARAGVFLFAEIFIQALADGTTAIRAGRGRNGGAVQGTTAGAAADRYRLRGSFAGRKKSNDHAGGAQS